ncbi:hypothetical protein ACQKWADRAFT_299988 [Trichoderma austrokoningii]
MYRYYVLYLAGIIALGVSTPSRHLIAGRIACRDMPAPGALCRSCLRGSTMLHPVWSACGRLSRGNSCRIPGADAYSCCRVLLIISSALGSPPFLYMSCRVVLSRMNQQALVQVPGSQN